jgi:uncharacterized damage-inducible protein DinB
MKRSKELASRLEEVLLNGYWIANTNYKQQIESLTWEQAIYKVENLNSIAALTFHINYYLEGILNVLKSGNLEIKDQYSFDMPPITSESDWNQLKSEFIENAETFIKKVANLPDYKLDEAFVDTKYGTYLRNIDGIIEHSYYHLGQISMIKKLTTEPNRNITL